MLWPSGLADGLDGRWPRLVGGLLGKVCVKSVQCVYVVCVFNDECLVRHQVFRVVNYLQTRGCERFVAVRREDRGGRHLHI